MKRKSQIYRSIWYLISGLFLYLTALLTGEISPFEFSGRSVAQEFQVTLHDKEIELHDLMEELKDNYEGEEDYDSYWKYFTEKTQMSGTGEGMIISVYVNDTLSYWSDNSIQLGSVYQDSLFGKPVAFYNNAWYERKILEDESVRFIGLILIKQEYEYENQYLENEFQKAFSVPPNTRLVEGDAGSIKIHSVSGEFLFSLDISEAPPFSPQQAYFSLILYLAAIVLISVFLRRALLLLHPGSQRNTGLAFFGLSLIILYILVCKLLVPRQFGILDLFNPDRFAVSQWFASLFDLMIWSYFVFLLAYHFFSEFRYRSGNSTGNSWYHKFGIILYFILLILFNQYVNIIVSSLVKHSNISFLAYRVLDIDIHTFIGFLIIGLHYASFGLLADKFITVFRPGPRALNLVIYLAAFMLGTWLSGLICNWQTDVFLIVFPSCILLVLALKRYRENSQYRHSTFVLLISLFSILSVYQVILLSSRKQASQMKVIAVDLSAEHDPVAELLLQEIEDQVASDTALSLLVNDPYIDVLEIYDYLTDNYFMGFWEKYDLQFTLCSASDSVFVEPPVDRSFHCYSFFDDLVDSFGIRISGTDFYFFDNLNGRISYFSAIPFWLADSSFQTTLFLELDSRMFSRELGYPGLLLSDRFQPSSKNDQVSFAKYHRTDLITQSGEISYSLSRNKYTQGEEEFEFLRMERHKHLVFNPDEDNTIIVSRPVIRWLDVLITFTYIFMFFYLCMSLNLLIIYIPFLRRSFKLNIKNKIQYSIILILILSLILIGTGSIIFSVNQFKLRQYGSLSERIQSVYVELVHKLEYEPDITSGWQSDDYQNLDELLRKFSNVFYTDIHLFDAEGEMIATSRPEIFEKGLVGQRMHPEAYFRMAIDRSNEFVNEEHIGSLNFLSAYVPFFNVENKLLAYLNLPYFTKQDVLTREISNMVVGIVNFYLLLISISVLVAVFISVRITQPLQMLQSKFGKITLGKTNEIIDYESDDEIGGLIKEYNHMVEQLAESAELLARSERESAWREMAKQIAHEIKNPLTPMKLSVQHLKRSWKDNPENWEQNLERIAQTLVEQIDTLSSIATEFSNFAQMPKPKNATLNLGNQIARTVELFEKTSEVQFVTEFRNDAPVIVFADKEQLSSVFINLIKNAIQAIPMEREGIIKIIIDTEKESAVIRISDNGKGIPEELGDKLFQPNFTTKSGGMGMGLAIVKNIIDNAGGRISYETRFDEGTTFIVELPLISSQETE